MSSKCYGIDGSPYATLDRYIPCNATHASSGGHTSCCAPGDNCLTNGLCQGPADNTRKANIFWRNGCTDPTWNDPACAKVCEGIESPATHAVFYCLAADTWCCPTGSFDTNAIVNTTCCKSPELLFQKADPVVYTIADIHIVSTMSMADVRIAATPTTKVESAVATGASAVTQVAVASGSGSAITSLAQAHDSKIGMYVGVPLGIALAIVLAVVAWLVVQNRRLKNTAKGGAYASEGFVDTRQMRHTSSCVHELGTSPEELPDGDYLRAELGIEKY